MEIPGEYDGREQTYLKHQVLRNYLRAWGAKLASRGRYAPTTIWYVDCFAGPWRAQDDEFADTSVSIGIRALEDAATTWGIRGARVRVGAIFVEKDPDSFNRLQEALLKLAPKRVKPRALQGALGDHVAAIAETLGDDPALVLVDPTGWKGAGMRHIAPLVNRPKRDVIVNVMFTYINRFKDDPRTFLREQMRDFFGLDDRDLPPELDEEALMALYRDQLRSRAGLTHVADLAIPHPTNDRTFFRLVVGGHHPEVLRVFRDVEAQVVGAQAAHVRETAKRKRTEAKTGQTTLELGPSGPDRRYRDLRDTGLAVAEKEIPELLLAGSLTFADIWPRLLARHHVRYQDIKDLITRLEGEGHVEVTGRRPRERTVKDEHILTARRE